MPDTCSRMGTSLGLDTSYYPTASSPNHEVGALSVGGGDGAQSQQADTHGSPSQGPLEERHEAEYNTPLPLSLSRDIVSPDSMLSE
ncbi:hypothetical protein TSMEX_010521 [Taenia solium]|eukprot:TsM_000057500 transcript=TsM_000057500 gene=TsM_000057500